MPFLVAALPYIAVAGAVAGTAVAVVGAQQAAAASDRNAAMAKSQGVQAMQEAQYAAAQVRRRNLAVLGRQRATAAASGIEINGSASDVINDSAIQGEMDVMAQLYTGKSRVRAANAQAQNYSDNADAQLLGGYMSAGSTLLTGLGGAASAYDKANPPKTAPTIG